MRRAALEWAVTGDAAGPGQNVQLNPNRQYTPDSAQGLTRLPFAEVPIDAPVPASIHERIASMPVT